MNKYQRPIRSPRHCASRASLHILMAALALILTAGRTLAINASPTPVQLQQPDGTSITLRVRGDEYTHWFEDLNGYTVMLNKGAYVYAVLDPQGGLAPTTLAVGLANPATSGLTIQTSPTPAYRQQRRTANTAQAAPPSASIAPVGTIKNLVILCKFSNHTNGIHNRAPADYTTLMNTIGGDPALAPTGSLLDYYKTNSYGTMTLTSTVIAWVNLPQTEAYYAGGSNGLDAPYPNNAQRMVEDALNAANATVNFGQFDSDNDGFIDAIDIIHSGYGAETGGGSGNWIWSHRWGLPSAWSSGDTNALGVSVKVSAYHTEPALWSTSGTNILRVGVIAHETGHFFGLPDLYDTDNSSEGIGSWCLMANSWGFDNSQLHPPQFSAWCRQQLNFTVPTVITAGTYNIGRAETVSQSYKVSLGYPSGEYLLIENRQAWGFETDIPQGGLCIWHIDEAKANNTAEGYPGQAGWPANNNHYKIALLQADGLYQLEHGLNRGNGGDVFHGAGVNTLGAATNTWPNTAAYKSGNIINTSNVISAISISGSNMSFTLATGVFLPPPTIPEAVDATNLTWTTGGHTPAWEGQTSITHDGVDAAQSGAIGDLQTNYVETVVTGPSTLSFWWKVSSESGYDFLRVAMDGNISNSISGEVNWQLINLSIPAGTHTMRWSYARDVDTAGGLNTAWLDQVTNATTAVAPVLAAIEAGALAYTENQAATAVTATITVTDADSANLASGSVSITANFASGQDVLSMSPNPQNGITATYNAGTGVLSLSGSATVANYQTALRSVRYNNSSESPSTLTRTVTYLVNDGALNSNPQARNITVATVNDAPTLAAIEAGALAYTENQAATAITATLTASDVDNANLASGTVSITANFTSGQDVLAMSPNPQNGITASYNAGTGVLSLSGSATVANYQAALRAVTYFNSSQSPSTLTRTVSFVVNDGAVNSSAQTRNITVATLNDVPTLAAIEAGALAYTENQAATLITATLTAADLDNANLASGTVSITANFASGQDVLAMSPNPQNGITATYNAGTGVLSLNGSATVANYQAALRSITYFNSSENPSTATRTVSCLVNDGTANSSAATRNITVAGVNDAPVLAAIEAGALSYAVHQVATALTATLTASDADNANLVSGSVSLTAGFASGQDVLAMAPNPQNGITASYNAGTGVLSLSGSSSVANYQAALRSVTYTNSSSSPSTATRTVRWLVNDGAVNSNPQTRDINVTGSGPRVAVVGAESAAWNQDVRQKLLGLGVFGAVDIFQADTATPSLAQLQNYGAVLVYPDQPFLNAAGLGDNLADYVDGGGRVVVSTFALDAGGGLGLAGRLVSGGYLPYVPGAQASGVELALEADNPGHPILAGVGSFSGGESSYHNVVSLAAGGSLVAHWDNGVPLVLTKLSGPGRVVGLNMFPPSETVRSDFWRTNSAGARLMGNALLWTNAVPVPPVSPVDTNLPSILLFVDDTSVPSAYQGALAYSGLPYQLFTDETSFNDTVSTSAPNSTLVVVDSIAGVHDFGPVVSFVASGGRAIVYYWNLDGEAGLAAAFNATAVQDIHTPVSVNDWGGSFFFSHVGSPLALFEQGYDDDGDKLQPTAGGAAVAGHTASAADGQACVVIGNGGRTILNSMALQDATNATVQAAQFALNEIFYLLAPGHGGGRVAVIGAEPTAGWNEDVRQKLLGTGAFEAVDIFQADALTPTLAQLQPYSAVLVYSDFGFNNPTALGNVLADYADAGGGVVLGTFALTDVSYNIAGRLLTGGYLPFVAGAIGTASDISLMADQASHPILAGVGSLVGGGSSFHNVVTVAPNADLIAHWSNGRPLVMTKVSGSARVVGLNFFPPSEAVRNDLWRTNSAGGLLMANALRWSALPDCTLKTNYVAATTFTDAVLADISVAVAFDGTNFWSASGGDIGGDRLARYSAAGVFQATFTPGIDFRSLFTDAGGRLYARGVNSQEILRQTTPGTFVTHAILSGGSLNGQAAVILNGNANEYVALNVGTVSRWSTNGTFLGDVTLAGFGTVAGEDGDLQNVRLAAVGNNWLTYNGNQVLSVWNQSGSRIGTTVLPDAGTSFDSGVSISYCTGKVFILDTSGGLWRGYDICTSPERPYLSNPVRLAGGQFQMNLHAPPARSYTIERSADFTSWTPFLTNTPLAPNTVITDTGAAGSNLLYRARTP